MVQTAHSVTWPLNHPATDYPTCAWPSLVLCTKSTTPASILVAARHATHVTYTSWDKQTRFSTQTNRGRTIKISWIQNQTMDINYSSRIKPRYSPLGFSISPLMSTLTTQKHKVWILNPRPHDTQLEDHKPKKSSRRSSRRRKKHKANKWHKKPQTKEKAKKSSNSKLS
jgi:hypothetical protein